MRPFLKEIVNDSDTAPFANSRLAHLMIGLARRAYRAFRSSLGSLFFDKPAGIETTRGVY